MKVFLKWALITAGIFAAIGIVSICIGISLGGSLEDYHRIGFFYDDGKLKFYPRGEVDDLEDIWENKWDRIEDRIEDRWEQRRTIDL